MTDGPLAKKSLGQHWLYDQTSLQAMCEAADVQSTNTVLEIGPGLGSLTELLVARAGQVIAVELDEKLAATLPGKFPANKLQVVSQDILKFNFTSLPANYKIVANIPYYLTSHLIRVISETPNPPALAALLVQKEVAERVAANPGAMSLLSVTAQFYWQVSLGREVPAELFTPPPKVNSQILILKHRAKPLFPDVDTGTFFRLVKASFAQRRKTLLNSLSAGLHLERDKVQNICQKASIDPNRRAQTLSLDDWYALYQALHA
jgi:16S rRNA (adenine1518-N6/adenine1519-N6)-dimethyltransferase